MDELQMTRDLVAVECRRVIDLLYGGNLRRTSSIDSTADLAELKRKMRELRRDTVRLEKLLYK